MRTVLPQPPTHPSGGGGSASLLVWLVAFILGFVALAVAAGSARERRSHFWARVGLGALTVPALVAVLLILDKLGLAENVTLILILVILMLLLPAMLIFAPSMLYHRSARPPGSSDEDGGQGPGPEPPPSQPVGPVGGVPLPHADQALLRLRDHDRPGLVRVAPRRRAREPKRTSTPADR
jgi:hypothetical protein